MIITFRVEGQPQGKGRHRTTKAGHTYTPEKTIYYENWVKICYLNQVGNKKLQGPLRAYITAFYKIPPSTKSQAKRVQMVKGIIRPQIKPDVDNIAKVVLDSLNGIAYADDKSVVELVVNKFYSSGEGYVEIQLVELEPIE